MPNEPLSQGVLGLVGEPSMTREDFLADSSNEDALGLIDRWPDWRRPALVIWGPAGSGKTHLLEIWRRKAGASALPPLEALRDGKPAAIDDAESMASQGEEVFLHGLNAALSQGAPLLMASILAPGRWRVRLPDLRSRIRALPAVAIGWPGERLLRAILIKIFMDRHRAVPDHVVSYLLRRLERAPARIRQAALMLDRMAEAEMRPVSLSLARRVIADLGALD